VDNPFKSLPPKQQKALAVVGVGAAGYVTWKWLTRDKSAGTDIPPTTSSTDGDLAGTGVIGSNVGGSENVGNSGNRDPDAITTSGKWYDAAVEKLSNAGWNAQAVQSALGEFLTGQPLDSEEARIVRAAVGAMGGYPPGGPTTVKETAGPTDASKLSAPKGVKVVSHDSTSADLSWSPVPGATEYGVFNGGAIQSIARTTGTSVKAGTLQPGKTYTLYVAGYVGGKPGPRSAGVTVKTANKVLTKPVNLKVTQVSKTGAHLGWYSSTGGPYLVRRSGSSQTWESVDAAINLTGLKAGTRYSYQVAAVTPGTRTPGPWSGYVTFTTKR